MGILDSIFKAFSGDRESAASGSERRPVYGYPSDSRPKVPTASKPSCQQVRESDGLDITPTLRHALSLLADTERHLFITGGAGTGKSALLRHFVKCTSKRVAVLAPTGLAALNIGGTTVHSFAHLPPQLINSQVLSGIRASQATRKMVRNLDMVIVDEVSMIRADVLDGLDAFLKVARGTKLPFGGIQMVFIGDLFQLPPVCKQDVSSMFGGAGPNRWASPFFFSARSLTNAEAELHPVILEQNFRQATDLALSAILDEIRLGRASSSSLSILSARVQKWPDPGEITSLTPTNADAEIINRDQLERLPGREYCFPASVSGRFNNDLAEDRLPAPELLKLRVGAKVIFTKNDLEGRWRNGTSGIVAHVDESSIEVINQDNPARPRFLVQQTTWERVAYRWDEAANELRAEVLGSFRQFPLTLAWALTIHKAQGKTLAVVGVDLGAGAFASGQTYVALSRCRSLEGLFLRAPLRKEDILCDDRVVAFNEAIRGQWEKQRPKIANVGPS